LDAPEQRKQYNAAAYAIVNKVLQCPGVAAAARIRATHVESAPEDPARKAADQRTQNCESACVKQMDACHNQCDFKFDMAGAGADGSRIMELHTLCAQQCNADVDTCKAACQ
jgi:hypothetical protein